MTRSEFTSIVLVVQGVGGLVESCLLLGFCGAVLLRVLYMYKGRHLFDIKKRLLVQHKCLGGNYMYVERVYVL